MTDLTQDLALLNILHEARALLSGEWTLTIGADAAWVDGKYRAYVPHDGRPAEAMAAAVSALRKVLEKE